MSEEYRIVEFYKRGEKIYQGKAHRLGWSIYKKIAGHWVFDKRVLEGK